MSANKRIPEIVLGFDADKGAPGVDEDAFNPLARATRDLMQKGSRFRGAAPVFLGDPIDGFLRWFGLFVEGASGRIVFFPGLVEQHDRMRLQRPGHPHQEIPHLADHFTLEADRETWHATEYAPGAGKNGPSRQHQGGPRTWDLGHGRVLWFGFTVPRLDVLRQTRARTVTRAPAPRNDQEARNRILTFKSAVEAASTAILTMPGSLLSARGVLHFAVVVAPVGAPPYRGSLRGFPDSWEGGFTASASDVTEVATRSHAVRLSERVQLEIFSAWYPGEMSVPVMLTGLDAGSPRDSRGGRVPRGVVVP